MKSYRSWIVAALALTAALLAVAFVPQLLGSEVQKALHGLSHARPVWLWLAGLGFLGSLAGSAAAWRSALGLVGGRVAPLDAGARYGVGSLVNSLAPARIGDAVRIALFSHALDEDERVWRTGGVFAALGAARAFVMALLVVAGSLAGALPLWPVLVCVGFVAIAAAVAIGSRNRTARSHVAHLLDAFRALGREPGRSTRIVGWIAFGTLCRLGAAASIAAALGVHGAPAAAVIIVAVLDLAGIMPLTPGNVGVTSGAVAMALSAHGVSMTTALTTGIAFHAVETAAGLIVGLASALFLAPFSSPATRRWAVVAGTAFGCLVLVAGFSATVLADMV